MLPYLDVEEPAQSTGSKRSFTDEIRPRIAACRRFRLAASIAAAGEAAGDSRAYGRRRYRITTIAIDGRTLAYTARAGTMTLRNGDDQPTARVFYTAYTLDGVESLAAAGHVPL